MQNNAPTFDMSLRELLQMSEVDDIRITGICEHTAEVKEGFAFCAVSDNAKVVAQHTLAAAESGAVVALVRADVQLPELDIPIVSVSGLERRRGLLARRFYQDPTRKITCIGITGTNGKTSIAYHLADMLEKLGLSAGYIGTLGCGQLSDLQDFGMTTPNAMAMQRIIAALVEADIEYVGIEVSSHALDQGRVDEVAIDSAIFSNLTRDHLDYHGDMATYKGAKERLFLQQELKHAIINIADDFGRELVAKLQLYKPAVQVHTYAQGVDSANWSWHWQDAKSGLVEWTGPTGTFSVCMSTVADYVVDNITAAMVALVANGVEVSDIVPVLAQLDAVPGRMQPIVDGNADAEQLKPQVFVDYAHTPDALQKILQALSKYCKGRMICIVGCGGDRDKGKRAQMAAVAEKYSTIVWLTSDNPRSEEPRSIIADMEKGMVGDSYNVEVDRREAIFQAIAMAQGQDTLLVAGKGHETYQEVCGEKLPFDDCLIAQQALQQWSNGVSV